MNSNSRSGLSVTIGDVNVGAGATAVIGTNQVGSSFETKQQLAQRCKNALFVSEPGSVRAELISFKGDLTKGTCEWIRDNDTYQSWLQADDSQLLWISGGPGRGKTMLSIFLTHELEALASDSFSLVLYVFCGDKSHSSEIAILRSLLYQIIDKSPAMTRHAAAVTERTGHTLASREDLWTIFIDIVRDPEVGPILCLIDGLDECNQEAIRWLLKSVHAIFDKGSQSTLSPPNPFKLLITNSIALDVVRVINAKIQEHDIFSELGHEFINEVKETLEKRSGGTFLWVGFAIRELLSAETKTEMRRVLEAMPQGLEALYSHILLRIKVRWREDIAQLLHWVIQARHSLTASELAGAMGAQVQTILDLVTMSGSLLTWGQRPEYTIVRFEWGRSDHRVVKLLHASVSDFLRGTARSGIKPPVEFRMDAEITEFEMAQICLNAVEIGFSDLQRHDSERYAFLPYAMDFWAEHARRCGPHIDKLWDTKATFFQTKDPQYVRLNWWTNYHESSFTSHDDYPLGKDTDISLLVVCSALGLLPWVDKLLREGHNVHYVDFKGFDALYYALKNGHLSVAKLLVDHGASLTRVINDQQNFRPIHLAMQLGPELAEPFIKRALAGYRFNPLRRWFPFRDKHLERSMFQQAADQGDEKLVQMLLDNGAELDSETRSLALRIALDKNQNSSLAEWLLNNGAGSKDI
ncbi:hypothetical protein FDECE_6991 [Fusarium decemcellulare]|nr:hypothetical protein FDECE_6991 [Fusarium decemcellulare]